MMIVIVYDVFKTIMYEFVQIEHKKQREGVILQ